LPWKTENVTGLFPAEIF